MRAGVTLKRSVRAGIASLGIVVAAVLVSVGLAAQSPSQRLVVYALNPVLSGNSIDPPTVSAVRSDGSRIRIGAGGRPALSPDGRWVAVLRSKVSLSAVSVRSELRLLSPNGGRPRTLLRLPLNEDLPGSRIAWSPDSSHLVVALNRALVVVAMPGGTVRMIARDSHVKSLGNLGYLSASFSPDGKSIVYESLGLISRLYVVRVTGGKPRLLRTDAGSPVWGSRGIAFERHGPDVWLIQPDGTGAHQITNTGERIEPVAWSADGSRLVANENRPPGQVRGVWSIDLRSHQSVQLRPGASRELNALGLSRDGTSILAQSGDCDTSPRRSATARIETVPFHGGARHIIVDGCGTASWNT